MRFRGEVFYLPGVFEANKKLRALHIVCFRVHTDEDYTGLASVSVQESPPNSVRIQKPIIESAFQGHWRAFGRDRKHLLVPSTDALSLRKPPGATRRHFSASHPFRACEVLSSQDPRKGMKG